jgi:hypothetical protein
MKSKTIVLQLLYLIDKGALIENPKKTGYLIVPEKLEGLKCRVTGRKKWHENCTLHNTCNSPWWLIVRNENNPGKKQIRLFGMWPHNRKMSDPYESDFVDYVNAGRIEFI